MFRVVLSTFVVAATLADSPSASTSSSSSPKLPTKLRGQNVHQAAELEAALLEILNSMDEPSEAGGYLGERLNFIESSMASTYQALPKNEYGRLGARSVHYVMYSYFAKEHGWQIRGFEPEGWKVSSDDSSSTGSNIAVLEHHLPAALEGILDARRSNHGLALSDVVAMAALLERLFAEEAVRLLETAYRWNNVSVTTSLKPDELESVLASLVLLLRNPEDAEEESPVLEVDEHATEFQRDAFQNVYYEQQHRLNPFTNRQFTFRDASRVVARLTNQYGKWSNAECHSMKEELMSLAPKDSGLIPLARFYQHDKTNNFRFWESENYLREIGALEESNPASPQVRISNYIVGPTNCIGRSSFYSVCCLDECQAVLSEVESVIRAPTATAKRLLKVVEGISTSTVDGPRSLPADLEAKLEAVASHHDGSVPLHGRLFAQWLHLAFPNECAYPQVLTSSSASPLTAEDVSSGDYISSVQDMERYVQNVDSFAAGPTESIWTDDEVLPLLETKASHPIGDAVRTAVMLLLLVAVLSTARKSLKSASSAKFGGPLSKSKDSLPMYS